MSPLPAHEPRLAVPSKSYVVTIMGNRGAYQVPLALNEQGLLEKYFTDFYTPDWLSGWLGERYPALRKRHHPSIRSRRTHSGFDICAYQAAMSLLKLPPNRHWARLDAWLSRQAASYARRHPDAGLLSYQNYAHHAFTRLRNSPKILFQYHPHPSFFEQLYRADLERFPEVQWSFDNERDTQSSAMYAPETLTESHHADAVICTSGVIKRSLEHAGCERPIRVVPYGRLRSFSFADPPARKAGEHCRFLFVGQGVQRKGLHHLLRAWRQADLSCSTLDIVASPLDPGIREQLPLRGVNLLGRVSDDELARLFAEANVFVMPSLVEGFGRVYLEALSAGCFCLGTTNTGLPDLSLGGNMVDYVKVGAIDALSAKLELLEARWLDRTLDPRAIANAAAALCPADYRARLRAAIADIERTVLN